MQLLQVVDTTISQLGSTYSFTNSAAEYIPVPVYHSPTRILVCEITGTSYIWATIDLTNNHASWIGIANQSIASAATGYVVTHGTSPVPVTTLATGSLYYTDIDGAFTTLTNGTRVGIAYSTTQLVVRS
jgi:hypothetical protein